MTADHKLMTFTWIGLKRLDMPSSVHLGNITKLHAQTVLSWTQSCFPTFIINPLTVRFLSEEITKNTETTTTKKLVKTHFVLKLQSLFSLFKLFGFV